MIRNNFSSIQNSDSSVKENRNLTKNINDQKLILCSDNNQEINITSFNCPVILLYFAAHWSPSCIAFTPILEKLYNHWNLKEKNVEIIFVSSDLDEESFKEFLGHMNWLSFRYKDPKGEELKIKCEIQDKDLPHNLPKLVVVDKNLNLIYQDGKKIVNLFGSKAIDEFKKLYNKL